ncbi:MAG: hypothetical protein B7Y00_00935 [Sphingomonadales bacterium 17-56-6]|nr:MAG: hypothetical protein B7Y44_11215 [Sphingomonadales bacterium 28-55-16]OYZ89777.1 MAG: hypothetical protein B7Y00_00935 [Sphingomonadales bacterium 17-56-6]
MKKHLIIGVAAAALNALLPATAVNAQTASSAVTASSEDARLTAFLDAEFSTYLKQQPQVATRLGMQDGGDRWNDISDEAAAAMVKWREASVTRMKAQFDRNTLSPEARVNYDIWALEAERAALSEANRLYRPPFYSRLYSAHSQLADFLVNTHGVADVTDLKNYISRLRGMPAVLDKAIALTEKSARAGIHAPKFQIESVISGSQKLTSGAPFGAGPDSALWADVQAKTEALVTAGKIQRSEADALLAEARSAILALQPAYGRVIAWAKASLPNAPSGRVGAISLPGGAAYYANELKLNTTTDYSADDIHKIGLLIVVEK